MYELIYLLQDVPRLYGAERVTLDLLAALGRRVPVTLCLIGEERLGAAPGALHDAALAAGLRVERIPVAGRFSWALVRALRDLLARATEPILHTVGYKAHLHALVAARGRAKTVTTIHGWLVRPEWKERGFEWIEERALRFDDAVICLTHFYERRLLEGGVRRARLHRIPTGLDLEHLPPRVAMETWPDGPFTIALAGRLSWEKNHALLLRAAARLRDAGVAFRAILAGEGPERPALEAQVRALGLDACVEFAGYVPMADLMPRVHAVVLCSRIENLPLSLLEAMAWSRPVVATDVGGVSDVVVEGETGFLVDSDDERALADRLARCAREFDLARQMGRAGRMRVEREFGLQQCVDRHLALYEELRT